MFALPPVVPGVLPTTVGELAAAIQSGHSVGPSDFDADARDQLREMFTWSLPAPASRRRDCHSAAPHPLPLLGVSIGMERGCQQNDSLADG